MSADGLGAGMESMPAGRAGYIRPPGCARALQEKETSAFTAAGRDQCAGWNPYFRKIGLAAALVTKSSNRWASGLAPFVRAMG